MMRKNSNRSGFTLIELLVVISIIGVLAGLLLVSFGGAQKQSRDTTRRSDLGQYRNALEGYAGNNGGKYPGLAAVTAQIISSSNLCQDGVLSNYLSSTCLTDPRAASGCDSQQYCYLEDGGPAVGANASNYVLFAHLETGGWWVICSNGKAGKNTTAPANWVCPL